MVVGLWNPLLLIAIALVSVPPPLAQMLQGKTTFLLKREQTQRERLRAYLERILTERAAAKEVRVFNLGSALLGWWEISLLAGGRPALSAAPLAVSG